MVQIDDDVFGEGAAWGASNEVIRLSGDFPPEEGVAALRRAGERFMLVDSRGVEYPTWELFNEIGGDYYSPNYVSDPIVRPDGVRLYVDCKGGIEDAMRERFLVVLREELAGFADARVSASEYPTD
jgi:hypothetical protein